MREIPDDCTIRTINLPTAVGGTICESPDGHINIYLNARLTREGQEEALDHELEHYYNDDLHNDEDIETIERRADHQKPVAQLVLARDLPKAKPRPKRATTPAKVAPPPHTDWKDDIYLKLPFFE